MASKELERAVRVRVSRALETFRVVAIVGPRQSGKTTLARSFAGPTRKLVSLDDLSVLSAARRDPTGFVRSLPVPVIIDEFQRAPDILLAIKHEVDSRRAPGMYLLTGSAEPSAIGQVRETLAGRIALVVLGGLTWAEVAGNPEWNPLERLTSLRSAREVLEVFGGSAQVTPLDELVNAGGFPEPVLHLSEDQRALWFDEFSRTYLERDVPQFVRLDDVYPFLRFVRAMAASTGTILNLAEVARDVGVSHNTADRWNSVLQSTFLVQELKPYWRNVRKRLAKAPKIHFLDTGLAMSLSGVNNLQQARRLNAAGAVVETWAFQMLRAFAALLPQRAALHTFRTVDQTECDVVLETSQGLFPIEVKSGLTVTHADAKGAQTFLDLFPAEAPFGIVLHAGTTAVPLSEKVVALPMASLFRGEGGPLAHVV